MSKSSLEVMAKIEKFLKKLPRNRQKEYERMESIVESLVRLMSGEVPAVLQTMIQLNNRYGQLLMREVLQSPACLECPQMMHLLVQSLLSSADDKTFGIKYLLVQGLEKQDLLLSAVAQALDLMLQRVCPGESVPVDLSSGTHLQMQEYLSLLVLLAPHPSLAPWRLS